MSSTTPEAASPGDDDRRRELYSLLGRLPTCSEPPQARVVRTETKGGYVLEQLLLELNGVEPVPAYFIKPLQLDGPRPTVLYNHASGDDLVLGKDELLRGRPALRNPPYADAWVGAGYNVLCLDMWGFGERGGRTLDELFKNMLWHGQVLWGMMVYDSLRAVSYLCGREDVDAQRIATLGMSSGSTMAWWTAALCPEVKVCVDICCLTDYQSLIASRGLDGHGVYYYVPDLLNHFTAGQINALIAPRPHLGLAGVFDPLTPPDGLDSIDDHVSAVYASLGAADAWQLSRYQCGHFETEGMRAEAMSFLAKWL
jgi:pimeloyl-ACP methyl ester carboxylesterase